MLRNTFNAFSFAIETIARHPWEVLAIALVFAIVHWLWSFLAALFSSFVLLSLLLGWGARPAISAGLIALLVSGFFVVRKELIQAEHAAVAAYYFLVTGTVIELIEAARARQKERKEDL
jgi:hypothetical protein